MADKSKIEWTDATWNPITGCSVISPGCKNCYAMRLAGGRLRHVPSRKGLTTASKNGPVWTGSVRWNLKFADQPLKWTKSRRIFVCAHSDLFHQKVADEWIDYVFAVMALSPQHQFQVLTKRPERMLEYLTQISVDGKPLADARDGVIYDKALEIGKRYALQRSELPWPLPNVWLGTSVEDQRRAEERIPFLWKVPAAVRWISAEPLLGPVNLGLLGTMPVVSGRWKPVHQNIDWVVVGGESGPRARPMFKGWVEDIQKECSEAGVPFFFKQWGRYCPIDEWEHGNPPREKWRWISPRGEVATDEEFRNGPMRNDAVAWSLCVDAGKRDAGRRLDKKIWERMPDGADSA